MVLQPTQPRSLPSLSTVSTTHTAGEGEFKHLASLFLRGGQEPRVLFRSDDAQGVLCTTRSPGGDFLVIKDIYKVMWVEENTWEYQLKNTWEHKLKNDFVGAFRTLVIFRED